MGNPYINERFKAWGLAEDKSASKVTTPDYEGDQARVKSEAARKAAQRLAEIKKRRKASSLLATTGAGVTDRAPTSSVLAYGKELMGQ